MCLTLEMAGQVHSFPDTDKLLHATTHFPLASSRLMSVIVRHPLGLHQSCTGLSFVVDVAQLCPLLLRLVVAALV